MDERTVDRIFAGGLTDLPPVSSKIVRIFTSSTFTDMLMERNTLMEWVYPKIREYCREKHGLEFQVIPRIWWIFKNESSINIKYDYMIYNNINLSSLGRGHAMGCERWNDKWAHDHSSVYDRTQELSETFDGTQFHIFWSPKVWLQVKKINSYLFS